MRPYAPVPNNYSDAAALFKKQAADNNNELTSALIGGGLGAALGGGAGALFSDDETRLRNALIGAALGGTAGGVGGYYGARLNDPSNFAKKMQAIRTLGGGVLGGFAGAGIGAWTDTKNKNNALRNALIGAVLGGAAGGIYGNVSTSDAAANAVYHALDLVTNPESVNSTRYFSTRLGAGAGALIGAGLGALENLGNPLDDLLRGSFVGAAVGGLGGAGLGVYAAPYLARRVRDSVDENFGVKEKLLLGGINIGKNLAGKHNLIQYLKSKFDEQLLK